MLQRKCPQPPHLPPVEPQHNAQGALIIRGALERAVRWHHLGVSIAAMAVAPSPERTEHDPPSADEAARLLNAA
jgi:hypothetical protein